MELCSISDVTLLFLLSDVYLSSSDSILFLLFVCYAAVWKAVLPSRELGTTPAAAPKHGVPPSDSAAAILSVVTVLGLAVYSETWLSAFTSCTSFIICYEF